MRYYCLALVLILISIAAGQLPESNPTNNTIINATANASIGAASSGAAIAEDSNRDLGVTLDVFEGNASTTHIFDLNNPEISKYEIYRIEVLNSGDVQINNIVLSALLAKGMAFSNSSYSDTSRGRLFTKVDPSMFDENLETNVSWELGSLAPEEAKTVIMALYLKPNVVASNVTVTVIGTKTDGIGLTDSQSTANVIDCMYFNPDEEGNYIIPLIKTVMLAHPEDYPQAKRICPSWIPISPP